MFQNLDYIKNFEQFIRKNNFSYNNYNIIFDKNKNPYLIVADISSVRFGIYKFFVYSEFEDNAVAYMSFNAQSENCFLSKLEIKNHNYAKLGIATSLNNFFEFFSYTLSSKIVEGLAYPLGDDLIDLEDLKGFYEKLGYSTQPVYIENIKAYSFSKPLDLQKQKLYKACIIPQTYNNLNFFVNSYSKNMIKENKEEQTK